MTTSRRNFLEGALAAPMLRALLHASPAALVAQAVVNRAFAQAAAGGEAPQVNYLALVTYGGPPRWAFDQFLKVRDSDVMAANPMIVTRFTGAGENLGAEYATINHQGVLAPYMWGTSVFNGAGAKRPLTDLLSHMVAFRGYGTGVDGHQSNAARQLAPINGLGSVTGTFADVSNRTFKAVQIPGGQSSATGYRSNRGTGITSVNSVYDIDSFEELLRPFGKRDETKRLTDKRAQYKHYMAEASRLMKGGTLGSVPGTDPLRVDHEAALRLLNAGLENLGANWPEIFGRYMKLIRDTILDRTVPGISDQAIVTKDDGKSQETEFSMQFPSLYSFPTPGQDLRDIFANMDIRAMARTFAIAEFLFTSGLGGCIETLAAGPANIEYYSNRDFTPGTNTTFASVKRTSYFSFDQHFVGAKSGLYMNSCYYRGLAAGISELMDRLKAKNAFQNTVIHVTGEFSRLARVSGGGSDHGFDAMSSSVFTGRHTGAPVVVGNVMKNGPNATYAGTFGYKAPTKIGGSPAGLLTPANVAASIVHIAGLSENPYSNTAPSLVSANGTQVRAVTEDARLVT
jgi:Protein of unknown function (DUF1501)